MEIADSARKHGVTDADIRHAVQQALRAVRQSDDRVLFIGPAGNGSPLEVVVLDAVGEDEPAVAIHAMPLRRKFREHLR
ncbi:MAG: hypothetical protein ACRDS1_17160 [Pseudonocardiaceae bacterium]